MAEIKQWDNGVKHWDVRLKSLEMNPWLKGYGYDLQSFDER